jgi:hypothetical protein
VAEARVTIVADELEAEMACRLLRAEGIACGYRLLPTVFDSEGGGGYVPGRREIIVDEHDLLRARELVVAEQPDAACAGCGRPTGAGGRWYSDGTGGLVPYCAGCAERELGSV